MPLRSTLLSARVLAAEIVPMRVLGAADAAPEPAPGPFDHLLAALDFSTGSSDVEARGFGVTRPDSWLVLEVSSSRLRCEAVQGGGDGSNAGVDLTRSWRYGAGPAFERRGNGCFLEVGPDAPVPTPADFDARIRVQALDAAELGPVPEGDTGQWVFGVLYFEGAESAGGCPDSLHVGFGVDGTSGQRSLECKNTQASVSTFPVTEQDVLEGDLRLVRVGQLFELSWRPSSAGRDLADDEDFEVLELFDRTAAPMPTSGHLGVSVYGGPDSECDMHLRVLQWTITET